MKELKPSDDLYPHPEDLKSYQPSARFKHWMDADHRMELAAQYRSGLLLGICWATAFWMALIVFAVWFNSHG